MPRKPAARAILALAALALIWGYNWVIMKRALHDSGPFTFTALRALLGALALFALLAARRQPLRPTHLPGVLVLGLLQTTGFLGFVLWALVSGGAGRTAVLAYTMPLWLLVLAWPLLGERIRGLQWVAVAAAGAGLVLILQPWRLHAHVLSAALAVLGGASWALAAIWAKHLRQRVHLELLSLTAWQMLLGALPLILIAAWREPPAIVWTPYFTATLAYNALLATALAWLLWFYALDKLPAGIAGMGTLAVPLIGLAAAWLRLGERPTPPEAAGMALILTGLAILAWERLRRPRSECRRTRRQSGRHQSGNRTRHRIRPISHRLPGAGAHTRGACAAPLRRWHAAGCGGNDKGFRNPETMYIPQLLSSSGMMLFHPLCKASNFEEPRAVVPHAKICTGAVG